ncbi:MAG: helix-turn-helix transcriptional regulator [bacterium]|nr:helix-turn-helix transcriptional regulator [bacterium]
MSNPTHKSYSDNEIQALIGKNVQRHREKQGLTLREMAEALGLTDHSGLVKIENGNENITVQRLCSLAEVFKVPAHALLMSDDHRDKACCENCDPLAALMQQSHRTLRVAKVSIELTETASAESE